ncbi:MAG TPA: aminopeptidase P family protein [Desulfobacterales bacterium]|nr:aminopeptidase P family protein [Desulfobacterales bacterium]
MNITPKKEIESRWTRYREFLGKYLPQCDGAFVFSRLNIFYFTGTFANGVLWLPIEGEPILFCRRGAERAEIETPLKNIVQFNSYGDIEKTFNNFAVTLPAAIATEMNGLSWSLSNSLMKYLPNIEFIPGDKLIAITRAKKSNWELQLLREAGKKHNKCLTKLLPPFLHEGINELQISHRISDIFYSEGHNGVLRMETFGEEIFLGHIAVGDSANYPSVFNGSVGLRGVHPAVPFMGAEEIKWDSGSLLTIDNGFTLAGYQTDKTQVYWLGSKSSIPESIRSAHKFCVEMQAVVAEQLHPGTIPDNLWHQCEEIVSKTPWLNGFMGLGNNKVSFVGHGIGLAIDEYPVVTKGFGLPLEEGMVLAIEPKIGIPGIGMVGTENTFEVTANGGQSLTGNNYEIITI